ncbi:HU family DNA-binding protein [Thermosulfurimonas sp. F29]|uniref:HU family DNA-binding protein n=1 Tax=Thermosulfurimonas sp. F29 TaxID=2867247 RepID=UPI001C83A761|nr:HU family DNA-binding protein [Thermosulfurimonas sp. F29]MBX6424226.1 HU family DNA-binding protein [Thermosulfurimonas sp. F29]
MTYTEIVQTIARREGVSKDVVKRVLGGFFEELAGMEKDESLVLRGFGTFTVRERASRKGRNPRTGEEITIPKRKVLAFKPARGLLKRLNAQSRRRRKK